jgi:hypothetical protein
MALMIELLPEWRDRLLAHLPEKSSSRRALEEASENYGYIGAPNFAYCVWCEEEEARTYLEVAKQYCPEAVVKIQMAIRHFQDHPRGRQPKVTALSWRSEGSASAGAVAIRRSSVKNESK